MWRAREAGVLADSREAAGKQETNRKFGTGRQRGTERGSGRQ